MWAASSVCTASTISSGSSSRIQCPLVRRHDVPAVGRRVGQAARAHAISDGRLMRAGNDDHRDLGRRNGGGHGRGFRLQDAQIVGHGVEALGLAPVRLHRRVELRRQLAYLADQSLERRRRARAEQLDEGAGRAGMSAGEQGERGANDADARKKGADERCLAGTFQQSGLRRRAIEPFDRRIDQHEARDLLRVPRRVAAHDEAAEGVADEDDPPPGTHANPRAGAERGDDDGQVVEDARERRRR